MITKCRTVQNPCGFASALRAGHRRLRLDAADGDRALNPGNAYPDWQQTIAARSVLPIALYRPGRTASRISCPVLAVISTGDQVVLAAPGLKAARRAPAGEVLQVDGAHYAAFLDQHETVVAAELDYLRRHLLQDNDGQR